MRGPLVAVLSSGGPMPRRVEPTGVAAGVTAGLVLYGAAWLPGWWIGAALQLACCVGCMHLWRLYPEADEAPAPSLPHLRPAPRPPLARAATGPTPWRDRMTDAEWALALRGEEVRPIE
jgi:hypothetical protein